MGSHLQPMMGHVLVVIRDRRMECVSHIVVVAALAGTLHEEPGPLDKLVH
jgi:hypothetical protein